MINLNGFLYLILHMWVINVAQSAFNPNAAWPIFITLVPKGDFRSPLLTLEQLEISGEVTNPSLESSSKSEL